MYKIAFIGGHFTTAQAVIDELLSGSYDVSSKDIIFFGKENESGTKSPEYREINKYQIKFVNIFAVKINRFITYKNIISFFLFPLSLLAALVTIIKYRPKVIVGFGGYLSIPICLAGLFLFRKIIIHEGTSRAGFANRIISKFKIPVLISFESSKKYFPKSVLVGCPLRKSVLNSKKTSGVIPIISIVGGHFGSKKINSVVFEIIHELLKDFIVFHQVGQLDEKHAISLRNQISPELRFKYVVKSFFTEEEYARNLSNSSVLIARSGINTVSEAIYLKIPSIFIPLPFAGKNEQLENAKIAEKLGLAVIIEQKNLNNENLKNQIYAMKKLDLSNVDNEKLKNLFLKASQKIAVLIYEEAKI